MSPTDLDVSAVATDRHDPLVSIGLPVWNGGALLAEALASIQAQDFADFELIISDNASTDDTEAICRAIADSDTRVRYIRQDTNLGAVANFNLVAQMARGRYFKWAAHDDVMAPGFLSACVAAFQADPRLVLAYPSTVLIDASSQVTGCYLDRLDSTDPDPVRRFDRWLVWGNHWCTPIFGLFPTETVKQLGPLGRYIGADHVFLGKLALIGPIRRIPQGLMLRRVHSGMSSQAHQGSSATATWLSGVRSSGIRFRNFRLLGELVRVVWCADLSVTERIRAFCALVPWVWRIRHRFLKEMMVPLYTNGAPTLFHLWLRKVLGLEARKRRRAMSRDKAAPRN